MTDNKPENLSSVEDNTRFSNIVNGNVIVKFQDLKDFITIERAGTMSGLANLMGFARSTFTDTLKSRGRHNSSIIIMYRLEKHYDIVIEDDPYR